MDDEFDIDNISPSACSSIRRQPQQDRLNQSGTTTLSSSSLWSSVSSTINTNSRRNSNRHRYNSNNNVTQTNANTNTNYNGSFNSNHFSTRSNNSRRTKSKSNINHQHPQQQQQPRIGNCSNRSSRSVLQFVYEDDAKNDNDECYNNVSKTYADFDNSMYKADDISSLYFDEHGYDVKNNVSATVNGSSSPVSVKSYTFKSSAAKPNNRNTYNYDDYDDDVSDFFKAPTQKELSIELFRLVEPNVSTSDALKSLGKLKMWGLVAENDPTTAKHFIDYRVVSILLCFVRYLMQTRRKLREQHMQHRYAKEDCKENYSGITAHNVMNIAVMDDDIGDELISTHHRDFVDASANIELSLHQAMQVIHYCACFGGNSDDDNNNNNDSNNKKDDSSFLRKAQLQKQVPMKEAFANQLVETDGVDLLVTLLEEQLADQVDRMVLASSTAGYISTTIGTGIATVAFCDNTTWGTTIGQYGHSVSKSIWGILVSVGASETAVRFLKTNSSSSIARNNTRINARKNNTRTNNNSMARKLVAGILIGLNHRFYLEKLFRDHHHQRDLYHSHCIMPLTSSSSTNCGKSDGSGNNGNDNNNSSPSSWLEDLFVTLCRLVGSKDVDGDDNNDCNNNHGNSSNNCNNPWGSNTTTSTTNNKKTTTTFLRPHQHDEIRFLLIELCLVKKCLKTLVDEPNTVLGRDSFVTTLAMSFFYACLSFATLRYPQLWQLQEQEQEQKQQQRTNTKQQQRSQRPCAEKLVSQSLDYNRLLHFTLTSIQSFPSHPLIQGTGSLILGSIPKAYKLLWMNPIMNLKMNNANGINLNSTNLMTKLLCSSSRSPSSLHSVVPNNDAFLCSPSNYFFDSNIDDDGNLVRTNETNQYSKYKHNARFRSRPPLMPFVPHRKTLASSFVGKVVEPCTWYCPTTT